MSFKETGSDHIQNKIHCMYWVGPKVKKPNELLGQLSIILYSSDNSFPLLDNL